MRYNIDLIKVLLVLFYWCAIIPSKAYNWPLTDGASQHQINATFGECRGSRNHFHNGVDIQAISGTAVIAIEGGTPYVRGAGVSIGHYRYYHITNIVIQNQVQVSAGDIIGYTDAANHIHFAECSQVINFYGDVPNNLCVNPLRGGGLTPFNDNGAPVIDDVTMYREGTGNIEEIGTMFGKYDFAVRAHDPGVTSSGGANNASSCGVYSISIEFRDYNDVLVGEPINYIRFNTLPNNQCINWAFANGSNSSIFIYWATNDPFSDPHNKYWNTRQCVNCSFDVDARVASELLYRESIIKIRVVVEDIAGNSAIRDLIL